MNACRPSESEMKIRGQNTELLSLTSFPEILSQEAYSRLAELGYKELAEQWRVTMLRHPLARIVSAYKHSTHEHAREHYRCCGVPPGLLRNLPKELNKQYSTEAFKEFALSPGMDNHMTRMLSGMNDYVRIRCASFVVLVCMYV